MRREGCENAQLIGAMVQMDDVPPSDFVEDAPVGLGLLDARSCWIYANDVFFRTTGLEADAILGRPVGATPFAADAATITRILTDERFRGEIVDGSAGVDADASAGWRVRYRRLERDGRVVGVTVAVVGSAPEGLHAPALDRRRLAMHLAASERIGTTLDIDVTCDELAKFTVPELADLTIVEVMPYEAADRGRVGGAGVPPRMRRAAFACAAGLRRRLGTRDLLGRPTRPGPESAVARGLGAGGPVAVNLPSADELEALAGNAEDLAAYRLIGVDSVLSAPLSVHGRVYGAVTMVRAG
jgi:hypothetical protein